MNGSISVGVVCRDIAGLGADTLEVEAFVNQYVAPAVLNEILARRQLWDSGVNSVQLRDFSAELAARGCEVSGNISISF